MKYFLNFQNFGMLNNVETKNQTPVFGGGIASSESQIADLKSKSSMSQFLPVKSKHGLHSILLT